jgi:RelB Antitoxin alpha helical domain
MFALHKNYVLDENQQPITVQIAIGDFERLEAILEDYGLARLMDEVPEDDRERLSNEEGMVYYEALKIGILTVISFASVEIN